MVHLNSTKSTCN